MQSLCNACGIRYKKEERRANAAAAAVVSNGGSDSTEGYHHHQYMMNNGNQWMNHSQSAYKMPSCYSTASAASNEYRFMDDVDDRDSPFLSWRLNVTDRPGLVHDFTRWKKRRYNIFNLMMTWRILLSHPWWRGNVGTNFFLFKILYVRKMY